MKNKAIHLEFFLQQRDRLSRIFWTFNRQLLSDKNFNGRDIK